MSSFELQTNNSEPDVSTIACEFRPLCAPERLEQFVKRNEAIQFEVYISFFASVFGIHTSREKKKK